MKYINILSLWLMNFFNYGLIKLYNHLAIQLAKFIVQLCTGLMMADRHPTGCQSPSLLCNGKMPVGEYWTISLCADWETLMVAIGINPLLIDNDFIKN